ncbi:MAG: GatB/YqeY domain-containing protein [Candidatus Omnitrophica bacterium]|nr:GatB/YqeY domain-containing protein [Candidatus Omnitrophota bacterium]
MTLEEKIMIDFKDAMKTRDQARTQTLSFLRSEMKYYAIDKKKDKLDDADVAAVIKKLAKQRQESIAQFEKGQRLDLADKEKNELSILKSYLPQEMSCAELETVVRSVISELGAASLKDMGRVIKEVQARTKGACDGKMMSDLVKKGLGGV